jgi:hypothetical protein
MPRKKAAPAPPAAAAPEPVAPPAPAPIPPAVLALQEDIVELVRSRSTYRAAVSEANTKAIVAQGELQAAQANLAAIDQEVQYRQSVIAQMMGRPVEAPQPFLVQSNPAPAAGSFAVSSVPTRPAVGQGFSSDPNDFVNHGHAVRDAL